MKTTRLTTILTALAAWLVAGAFMACEHKELCYDHAHVVPLRVVFDWSYAPDATPASMSFYLFPKDGQGEPLRYELTDREGGIIRVPERMTHYASTATPRG